MEQEEVFMEAAARLHALNLTIVKEDVSRPWGGFYVIDESQAKSFAAHFFPDENFEELNISGRLSPKLLMVAPGKRLSWQYHRRRAEIWRCIKGSAGVVKGDADEEESYSILQVGDTIQLKQGERHRLVGLNTWGVIAEIWQHTDFSNPSDEDDIVRLQDDFGR